MKRFKSNKQSNRYCTEWIVLCWFFSSMCLLSTRIDSLANKHSTFAYHNFHKTGSKTPKQYTIPPRLRQECRYLECYKLAYCRQISRCPEDTPFHTARHKKWRKNTKVTCDACATPIAMRFHFVACASLLFYVQKNQWYGMTMVVFRHYPGKSFYKINK